MFKYIYFICFHFFLFLSVLKKFLIVKVFFCFFFLAFSLKKNICSVFFFFVTTLFHFIYLLINFFFFFNLKFLVLFKKDFFSCFSFFFQQFLVFKN